MRALSKRCVEVAAVIAVYMLFFIVGLYSQTASTLAGVRAETASPPDGMRFRSSPIELAAIVTNQEAPLPNTSVTITVRSLTTNEVDELPGVTNEDGIFKVLFPAQSGDYAWYVAANIEGYPTTVSRPRSFSAEPGLIVECLDPCSPKYGPLLRHSQYLILQVVVTDMNRSPVESANVTFYVNSMGVYSILTDLRGLARMSLSNIPTGSYTWFATASKDGEGGASRLSSFEVE